MQFVRKLSERMLNFWTIWFLVAEYFLKTCFSVANIGFNLPYIKFNKRRYDLLIACCSAGRVAATAAAE